MRTGGKASHDVNDLLNVISDSLDSTESELRNRAAVHMENLVLDFPGIEQSSDGWKLTEPIEDGKVYELAFDGNDSDAEILEKATGLTFLGDCIDSYSEPKPCVVTGRMTTRKQHLARMY